MSESIQKKLLRTRPLRTKITYDVETGGNLEKKELPFRLGVIADLSGDLPPQGKPPLGERHFIPLDQQSLGDLWQRAQAQIRLDGIPGVADGTTLAFNRLEDFAPAAIARQLKLTPGAEPGLALSLLSHLLRLPRFQALEATWRSLSTLLASAETGPLLQIQVMNLSPREFADDLQQAPTPEETHLYQQLYAASYGTLGGTPYSLLLAAYEFGDETTDPQSLPLETLEQAAQIAAAHHAPLITGASPSLFEFDDFAQLAKSRKRLHPQAGSPLAAWAQHRSQEAANYLGLTLPHTQLRPPHGQVDGFVPALEDQPLWGNGAFLVAAQILKDFALHQWPSVIQGPGNEGEEAPLSPTPNGEVPTRLAPLAASLTPGKAQQLGALGFMALSRNKPPAQLPSPLDALPRLLAACRFAQYIKVIMRAKIGSFLTRSNVEAYLNTWLCQYVLLDDNAPLAVQAAYPLRAAQLTVTDLPGQPGAYRAVVFLNPRFQLPERAASLRLEIDLPA